MTCRELEFLIAGLIDGSLAEGEKERVEAHLQSCGDCRRALAELKASDAQLKALGEVEPPPWLKARVMARVREEPQERESAFRRLFFPLHIKVPIQALATVLIAVAAWNVYRTGESDFRQAAPPPAAVQEAPKAEAPHAPPPAAEAAKGESIPAIREKKAFAPPPAVMEDRGGPRAEPPRATVKADAAGPAETPGARRPAAAAPKGEEALKRSGAAVQPGSDSSAVIPAPGQKQKTAKVPLGAATREAPQGGAAPAAAPMLSAAVEPAPDLDITLRTHDPLSAAAEIEELLKNTGAQSIERKTRDGQTILTARIRPENLEALREKLKSLGQVRENVQASPRPGASLAIRLDIRSE